MKAVREDFVGAASWMVPGTARVLPSSLFGARKAGQGGLCHSRSWANAVLLSRSQCVGKGLESQ